MRTWLLRSVALLFVLVLVLSSFMTGTYAWDSHQKVTNSLYGSGIPKIPVTLIKMAKLADGTVTETVIPNTSFYLFREDGSQIGGQYLTDENGQIIIDLNPGSYYFEEIMPASGYAYDTDENGDPITQYPFTVNPSDTSFLIQAYNLPFSGDLLIRKTVKNIDGSPLSESQRDAIFTFTVTFSDGGSYDYLTSDGKSETLESGGTLKLKHGQTAVFEGIPGGILYTVTEQAPDGYTVSSDGHQGNITEEPSVAEFVNLIDPSRLGSLTISKSVIGNGANTDREFFFTVSLGSDTEILILKDGESKTFSGLPIGTEYSVTENNATADGYYPTVSSYSGQIVDSQALALPFVNAYVPVPEAETGNIMVSKQVLGESADPNKVFTFEIEFGGENAPEARTFSLMAGEIMIFDNIPHGVTYTITETDSGGYETATEAVSGTVVGNETCSVAFVNKVPTAPITLTVTKRLDGGYPEHDSDREFSFSLIVDGETTHFSLKADESKDFTVPVGAQYEIREDNYFADSYTQIITNGFGIATDDIETVITNTYFGQSLIDISGVKIWELGEHPNAALPEYITIRLMHEGHLFAEQKVSPDENGQWAYTFTVPKYDADGAEAVYTIEEDEIPGFRASYDGYNITNTYIPPIEIDVPPITKIVEGEDAPNTEFSFVLKGEPGYPMPEGAEGHIYRISITGAGQATFGSIPFSEPGVYSYTLYEENGRAAGWKYDPVIFTVIFTVTDSEEGLACEYQILRNHSSAESIRFTNHYTHIDMSETVTISGAKTWDHGNNPESERPQQITVEFYADGQFEAMQFVSAETGWKYSMELPKYNSSGHEIVYTVDEADVPGYSKVIIDFDIINIFDEPSIDPDTPDGYDTPADIILPADPDPTSPPTAPGSPGSSGDIPQTGDESHLALWIALMVLSSLGLFITILVGKKPAYKGKHVRRRKRTH